MGIDPYRPDATPGDRADHVISVILADDDAVRRYQTIQVLQAGRLRDAAALTLRQLRQEHGTTEAAAAAVGISRQAVNELLVKAGAPGAREDRGVLDTPAYAYGEYIASVLDVVARFHDKKARHDAIMRGYDLVSDATQSLAHLPTLAETGRQLVRHLRTNERRPRAAGRAATRIDECITPIEDWITAHSGDPHFTVAEQAAAWLGYHHARYRYRKEREEHQASID